MILFNETMIIIIITSAHENEHFIVKIEKSRYENEIPKLRDKISNVISCILRKRKDYLNTIAKRDTPHVDYFYLGPIIDKNKYKRLIQVIDAFLKFVYNMFSTKLTISTEILYESPIIPRIFGNPSRIISDQGMVYLFQFNVTIN